MSVRRSARGRVQKVRVVPKNKDGETTVHAERAAFAKGQVHEIRRRCSRAGARSGSLPHKIQVGGA